MYLKVHYNKEIHLLNKKVSFKELQSFIASSFKSLSNVIDITYLDPDGEYISISSEEDLQTLYESCGAGFTKVYINKQSENQETGTTNDKADESKDQNNDGVTTVNKSQNTEVLSKEQLPDQKTQKNQVQRLSSINEEKRQQQLNLDPDLKNNSLQQNDGVKPQPRGPTVEEPLPSIRPIPLIISSEKSQNTQQILKKEDQNIIQYDKQSQINKLVLQKLDEMVPIIVQKVKKILIQQKIEDSKNIHKVQCSHCLVQQIKGIRYSCSSCKKFNLCSSCQDVVVHPHNLIKIRKWQPEWVKERLEEEPHKVRGNVQKRQQYKQKQKQKPEYRAKERQIEPEVMKAIISSVKQIAGNTKEVQDFARKHANEGVDKIVDLWFTK